MREKEQSRWDAIDSFFMKIFRRYASKQSQKLILFFPQI